MSNLIKPNLGEEYCDIEGRKLTISKVDIGNRLGREIQGTIITKDINRDYCCTLETWHDIWHDKAPRVDPAKMKIG